MSLRAMAITSATEEAGADPKKEQDRLINQLVNLIPAEAVALFVALIAATVDKSYETRLWMFWLALALTPLWVAGNYILAADPEQGRPKLPWFDMFVGTVAFIAWALTVPGGPFSEHMLFLSDDGISVQDGLIVTLVTSGVLGFLVTVGRPAWRRWRGGGT